MRPSPDTGNSSLKSSPASRVAAPAVSGPAQAAQASPVDNSASTKLESATNNSAAGSSNHTSLQVNGKDVPLPENGTVEKIYSTDNGNVHFKATNQSTTSGTTNTSSVSSLNVQISTDTTNDSEVDTSP
jgi:hypothetical protein